MKAAIACVIYDCDGVLFDSLDANRSLYNHIALSMGRPELTEDELQYCHMHTVHESIHCLFPDNPRKEAEAQQFLKDKVDFKDFIPFLKMEPYLLETLADLKQRGILTAISTNRTTSMPHIMERFKLAPYFDMVVTALDVAHPKPDPESVDKILQSFKVAADRTLYIGDSEVDLKTATSAGVTFVAYKNAGISTGLCIDDHRSILTIISNGKL